MSRSFFTPPPPNRAPPTRCSNLHSAQHSWAWSRFADAVRDRQVPGFARRAAAAQTQFDWFADFAEEEAAFLAAKEDDIVAYELPEPHDSEFI